MVNLHIFYTTFWNLSFIRNPGKFSFCECEKSLEQVKEIRPPNEIGDLGGRAEII